MRRDGIQRAVSAHRVPCRLRMLLMLVLLSGGFNIWLPLAFAEPFMQGRERDDAMWKALSEAADVDDPALLHDRLEISLQTLSAREWGEVPGVARQLVDAGARAARRGKVESAQLLFSAALRVAPSDPWVNFALIPWTSQFQLPAWGTLVSRTIFGLRHAPDLLIEVCAVSMVPLLFALTIAVAIGSVVGLISSWGSALARLSVLMPTRIRWLVTPMVLLAIAILPIACGPIWTLIVWGCCFPFLMPARRRLGIVSGAVVILWSFGLPAHERLSAWTSNEDVRRFAVPSTFQSCSLKVPPYSDLGLDPVMQFYRAQRLRQVGEFDAARAALATALHELGNREEIQSESAILSYYMGDVAKADSLFTEVARRSSDAAIAFNASLVAFEVDDTKRSRELVAQARALSTPKTEELQRRENALGVDNPRTFADARLPLWVYFGSALSNPSPSEDVVMLQVAGVPALVVALLGAAVLIIQLFVPSGRRTVVPPEWRHLPQSHTLNVLALLLPGARLVRDNRIFGGTAMLMAAVWYLGLCAELLAGEGLLAVTLAPLRPFFLLFAVLGLFAGVHINLSERSGE